MVRSEGTSKQGAESASSESGRVTGTHWSGTDCHWLPIFVLCCVENQIKTCTFQAENVRQIQ
jgi:hypothetical protein